MLSLSRHEGSLPVCLRSFQAVAYFSWRSATAVASYAACVWETVASRKLLLPWEITAGRKLLPAVGDHGRQEKLAV